MKALFQADQRKVLQNTKGIRTGAFFFFSSLAAGGTNYLFQVVASRHLSGEDFSQLNGWFADLSALLMFGGLVQYAGVFWPASRKQLRLAIVSFHLFVFGSLWFWLSRPGVLTLDRAILVFMISTGFGWLMGQLQARKFFITFSLVNLVCAGTKLLMAWAPLGDPHEVTRYAFALFINVLPGLWVISLGLWNSSSVTRTGASSPSWGAPVVFSAATHLIPQFDLVLMHHTQNEASFTEFAHASLFYRGMYFLIFIFAQWLLPKQLEAQGSSHKKSLVRGFPALLLAMVLASFALSLLSPWISQWVLKWPTPPARTLILLTCVHMSLLAMVYLWIQEACARNQERFAALALLLLAIEAALQFTLQLSAMTYLVSAGVTQTLFLAYIYLRSFRSQEPEAKVFALPKSKADRISQTG